MQRAYLENDSIVAMATPSGTGAIGIVRLSGPRTIEITSALVTLSHFESLASLPSQKSARGIFHQNGTRVDQIMVTLFRAPRSYTGEDVVEISCHGGAAILKQILNIFLQAGARLAEPGEFSQRAFSNGKIDLAQAEAVADLIRSQTEFARSAALSQLEGTLSEEIRHLRNNLIEMLSHLEVNIDHSDDPTVGATMPVHAIEARLNQMLKKVRSLLNSYAFGRIAREGVRIAIVGKPNVGKSSLLNRLLRSDRAIVTETPGTTRDAIEESFDLMGLPAILVDTAGLRQNVSDPVEKIGIERTQKILAGAEAVIVLLDASDPLSEEDRKIAKLVRDKKKLIVALNKSDLAPKISQAEVKILFPQISVVPVSALKNSGIEEMLQKLSAVILSESCPKESSGRALLVTSLRHKNCLSETERSLLRAQALCRKNPMEECLAIEIREAMDSLGKIIGEFVTDELLKEIFSNFCIGK